MLYGGTLEVASTLLAVLLYLPEGHYFLVACFVRRIEGGGGEDKS